MEWVVVGGFKFLIGVKTLRGGQNFIGVKILREGQNFKRG